MPRMIMLKEKRKFDLKKSFAVTATIFFAFIFLFLIQINSVSASGITPKNIIQLVNKERFSQGLDVVMENSLLSSAAREKLNDMIKKNYFAHTSPGGLSPWHWIEKGGYDYQYAGENLAINFTSAEDQHKAWMASATHRKNILNASYKEIGVAVAEGTVEGKTSIITVQFFGTPVSATDSAKSAEPAEQGVKGEQAEQEQPLAPVVLKPLTLPFLSENKLLDNVSLKELNARQPECANGLCYFSEANSFFYKIKQNSEEAAWMLVVLILMLSIVINAATLSHEKNHNPFVAANTVILLLILTGVVFWKV